MGKFAKTWGKDAFTYVLKGFPQQTKEHDKHQCISRAYMLSDIENPKFRSKEDFSNMDQSEHDLDLYLEFWGVSIVFSMIL